jgi:hypothetical protein
VFARLTCDVLDGVFPSITSFPLNEVSIIDTAATTIPGAKVVISDILANDAIPPTLSVSTLADGAVTNNATLNIHGSGGDNTGITSVTINGKAVPLHLAINPEGMVTYDFDYPFSLSSVQNRITIIASDPAGNIQVDADNHPTPDVRTITLDQTAPAIFVTTPSDNSLTNAPLITITGTAAELLQKVDVTVGNGTPQAASMSGASFNATVGLASGPNTIRISATSLAGKSSDVKRTVTYAVQAPALAISEPSQDIITIRNPIVIKGSVTGNPSDVTLKISTDGKIYTPQLAADGSFAQSITFSSANQYQVTIVATDGAGHVTSAQRNIGYFPPDLNGDGRVDIADALFTLKIAVKLATPTANQLKSGDVAPLVNKAFSNDLNRDIGVSSPNGKLDISDALLILKKVVGLVTW